MRENSKLGAGSQRRFLRYSDGRHFGLGRGTDRACDRALAGIFPGELASSAERLEDLFSPEDLAEIRYVLKRARRTGTAACQLEIQRPSSVLHLAVTGASLEEQRGFVLVLEDTSDLLRAQKAAAWQEVARRIAHEIKNPLTPISLCADLSRDNCFDFI